MGLLLPIGNKTILYFLSLKESYCSLIHHCVGLEVSDFSKNWIISNDHPLFASCHGKTLFLPFIFLILLLTTETELETEETRLGERWQRRQKSVTSTRFTELITELIMCQPHSLKNEKCSPSLKTDSL